MLPARFASLCVLLLVAVAFAGCSGGSEERRRSQAVRLGQPGRAVVDGVDSESIDLTAARCVLASAVIVYSKTPNQTFGEYTLADVRPEYPNSLVSSIGFPALGPIYAHYHSILQCSDVQPIGRDFTLTFRSVRVEKPIWDDSNVSASHFTFGWVATDDAEVQALVADRTNLSVRMLVSSASEDLGDAYRIAFDVPQSQDIDAVFAARVEASPSTTRLRFWADRPELQESGGTLFLPVNIDVNASKVLRTTRYDQGVITGRFDLVPPLFTINGGMTQGNVTQFEDVQLRISQPYDHLLRRSWLPDPR